MYVWRIARAVYDPLDGEGARLYGGRWNQEGTPLVYASEHLSLAVLEQLVHLDVADVPGDYASFEIELPDALVIETVEADDLPNDWSEDINHPACQQLGTTWAAAKTAPVLRVPSAVLPLEHNYLIDPLHPDAKQITVVRQQPFRFDARLLSNR